MTKAIGKILSANDVGETGSHQVGVYIPRAPEILGFFPPLDEHTKNPQVHIDFVHDLDNTHYTFKFVHYNNKLFEPNGTRDEYRLTGMTEFFRVTGMQPGQTLVLYREGDQYYISDAPPPGGITPYNENWCVVAVQ